MKLTPFIAAGLIAAFVGTSFVWAEDDIRAAMNAANNEWAMAYNNQDGAALAGLYAKDAVLMFPGKQPVQGAEAIGRLWGDLTKAGNRKNFTMEVLSLDRDGKLAYETGRFSLDVLGEGGQTKKVSGNTVRIFGMEPNGKWLMKAHIFTID